MRKIWGECNTELKLVSDTKEDQVFLWFIEKLVSDRAVVMNFDNQRVLDAGAEVDKIAQELADFKNQRRSKFIKWIFG